MTYEEAAKERDRVYKETSERSGAERGQSLKDREQEVKRQNSERKQERESATNALTSGSADIKLAEIARQGGSVGRRLEREIRQFQQTGRVSSWLAGETIKAEAAQNSAQQSAFRQQVVDVISNPVAPIQVAPFNPSSLQLRRKPELKQAPDDTALRPWDLISGRDPNADPEDPDPPYLVTVRAGTLNAILPTNWNQEFICSPTGLYYAKAIITTDGTEITGVRIEIDTSKPTEQEPQEFAIETRIEYLFGLFAEGQVHRVIGDGNITVGPEVWMTKEKDSPAAAGELPYTLFYLLK